MTKVNIVFDNMFDDADIIAVPDILAADIEKIGQEFLWWVPSAPAEDRDYWAFKNGRKYLITETDGFLKWLNARYCQKTEKAYVIARNTNYCPRYKTIAF